MARALGWQPWSGPVFSLIWLTAGLGVWLWVVRPTGWKLAATAFLIATYWPYLLWSPTTMQEPLHCAIAFLLAASMWPAFAKEPRAWQSAAVILMIAASALIRLSWAFVLVPWAYLMLRGFTRQARAVGVGALGVLFVALALLSAELNAPHTRPEGAGFIRYLTSLWQQLPEAAVTLFIGHALRNLHRLVTTGHPLEMLFRYQYIALLAVAAAMAWRRRQDPDGRRPWVFTLLNLGAPLGACVFIYDIIDWKDHRVLSPHLLLSLLVLVPGAEWRWPVALSAVNLLFVPVFVTRYSEVNYIRVHWDRDVVAALRSELNDVLHYDPSKPPWDNTVLVPIHLTVYPLITVPSGIGIDCVLDWPVVPLPVKSRYLLIPPSDLPSLRQHGRVEVLKLTQLGLLCRNVDARRSTNPPPAVP
jgi:hypothetical protein